MTHQIRSNHHIAIAVHFTTCRHQNYTDPRVSSLYHCSTTLNFTAQHHTVAVRVVASRNATFTAPIITLLHLYITPHYHTVAFLYDSALQFTLPLLSNCLRIITLP